MRLFAPKGVMLINHVHSSPDLLGDYGNCGSQALVIEHYLLAPILSESYISVGLTEPKSHPHSRPTKKNPAARLSSTDVL